MELTGKTTLELAFEDFNKLVDEYSEAFALAETDTDKNVVQDKYDALIEEAEKALEADVEKDFVDSQAALEVEEKAFNEALIEQEKKDLAELEEQTKPVIIEETEDESDTTDELSEIEKELKYLKDEGLTPSEIAKRYNKTNSNKNGFSTTELYEFLKGEGKPKESLMAEYIFANLN